MSRFLSAASSECSTGLSWTRDGWRFFPDTAPLLLDGDVPYLSKGAVLTATSAQLDHEPAEPPRPLTVARLLHMMEVHGIGTDPRPEL